MKVVVAVACLAAFCDAGAVDTKCAGCYSEVSIATVKPICAMRDRCLNEALAFEKNAKRREYRLAMGLWAGEEDDLPPGRAGRRGSGRNSPERWAVAACLADGITRLGVMLDDRELLSDVALGIHYTVSNAQQDGFLGPNSDSSPAAAGGKNGKAKKRTFWPSAVYSRALLAYYARTREPEILHAIENHCDVAARDSLEGDDLLIVETMCSLYLATGNAKWRDMAVRCWDKRARRSGKRLSRRPAPAWVSAILCLASRRDADRSAAESCFEGIAAGDNLSMARDTCAVADGIWSLGYLLMASGEAKWGDAIERLYWNDASFRVLPDLKPCCAANAYRLTPAYLSRAWMKRSSDGAPVAALYCDSEFAFESEDAAIRFEERTAYPFNGRVFIRVQTPISSRQPFVFRVPSWTRYPEVLVNGNVQKVDLKPGSFAELCREWENGDVIVLDFPMETRQERVGGGVSFARGPLVFSHPVDCTAVRRKGGRSSRGSSGAGLPVEYLPKGTWNYGVRWYGEDELYDSVSVAGRGTTNVSMTVKAHRVPGWTAAKGRSGIPPIPALVQEEKGEAEEIVLVPMANARLGVAVFPETAPPSK